MNIEIIKIGIVGVFEIGLLCGIFYILKEYKKNKKKCLLLMSVGGILLMLGLPCGIISDCGWPIRLMTLIGMLIICVSATMRKLDKI